MPSGKLPRRTSSRCASGWAFAEAEGEGFRSVAHWREVHTEYWAGEGHTVADDTEVVCLWFRLA